MEGIHRSNIFAGKEKSVAFKLNPQSATNCSQLRMPMAGTRRKRKGRGGGALMGQKRKRNEVELPNCATPTNPKSGTMSTYRFCEFNPPQHQHGFRSSNILIL